MTIFVSKRYCISPWLGYNLFRMRHNVIQCRYVDSSYRGLIGDIPALCHEYRLRMGNRRGQKPSLSVAQEGLERSRWWNISNHLF